MFVIISIVIHAHIHFAQIKEEIEGLFDFLENIYGVFGFEFQLMLSTRPEKYLGEIETWNDAEKASSNISS